MKKKKILIPFIEVETSQDVVPKKFKCECFNDLFT